MNFIMHLPIHCNICVHGNTKILIIQIIAYVYVKELLRVIYGKYMQGVGSSGKYSMRPSQVLYLP